MDLNWVVHAVPNVPADVPSDKRIHWLAGNMKKFCVLPWLNLNTNPNGNVKLCCSIAMDYFVGFGKPAKPFNLGYDDIDTIWNSEHMLNVRDLHRQNNGSGDCADCYRMEKVSGHSPRKGQNKMWIMRQENDEELASHLNTITEYDGVNKKMFNTLDTLPLSLELRLGNQCNLKCITCWGMSSSLIQDERRDILRSGVLKEQKLDWLQDKWQDDYDLVEKSEITEWYETEMFYKNFRRMAPKLRRLYTTGGEPTLIKANYKMFEELIAAGNKNCKIEFTTNMTTWNPKFYEALSQFDNVEIQMSIDGVGSVAEYIRYGTKWDVVRENIKKVFEMASTRPNWRILCYTVLQALNYQYVTEIWDVLSKEAEFYKKRVEWWPITLSYPLYLGLAAIPKEDRIKSIPRIREKARQYDSGLANFTVNKDTMAALENSIINIPYNEMYSNQFKGYKKFLDSYRAKNG